MLSALTAGRGEVDLTKPSDKENSIDKAINDEFVNDIKKPTYEEGKITLSNGEEYTVTSSGKLTQPDVPNSTGKQWSLPEGDTEVNVGDLLTPTVEGLETEKFYVIADDGTTLTLLAERCVNTSTNKQVDSGYTTVAFDSGSNVYNGSDIQGLVNTFVGTLTGLDLEDVEVEYGGDAVTGVKGRLMWSKEAGNTTSPFKDAANYSDILYGPEAARINYWLGSPNGSGANRACFVDGDGERWSTSSNVDYSGGYGLRPVIKILKSNV